MATKEEIKTFSAMIEEIVWDRDVTYMDAILCHCEESGFEVELAATLLTPPIKAKILEEAQNANLMKKNNRLPI